MENLLLRIKISRHFVSQVHLHSFQDLKNKGSSHVNVQIMENGDGPNLTSLYYVLLPIHVSLEVRTQTISI